MSQLFVPISVNDKCGEFHLSLFSIACRTLEGHSNSEFNGQLYPELNKKLKECFPGGTFSFDVYECDKEDELFENFTENTASISLGILCSAYAAKEERMFKAKYDSIIVTGNFDIGKDGKICLKDVILLKEKYKVVQDYAGRNADKNHLFIYISSEEIIPEGLQENNVLVIRYDSNFPVECVYAEIFEEIEKGDSSIQKNRNEFIETRSFIKLKKDFVKNKSCNCFIIKGESNTGKTIAAEALCNYLVNSQLISDYVWFYVGDNGKLLELLRKEREELANSRIVSVFWGKQRSYIKKAYPKVFDEFERLLQTGKRCAIIIDNIEYDIVDDLFSFFNRNYPLDNRKYDLILTSWEGSKINQIASSINLWTIDISDISLNFEELKAITGSVIKINDYSKRYYESPENMQNELMNMISKLCCKYPGYIPLVLAALNTYSIKEILEIYAEKDIKDLCALERILKITFDQLEFLSKMVLFAYLQIKKFDDPVKENEIIAIINEKIFHNVPLLDKNGVQRAINVLQQYSFFKENDVGSFEIKKAVLHYTLFSEDMADEVKTARDLILSPEIKVEYAIEEKKLKEFSLYIDRITEKETQNKILIKLCESDSSLEFFQTLLTKDIDVNYVYNNVTPLQICAYKISDVRILDFLISKGSDMCKCPYGGLLLHCAVLNNVQNKDCTVLRYILERHCYGDINEMDNNGRSALHLACLYSTDIKSIELLLKYGADKDFKSNDGWALLHFAARNADAAILRYILKHHYYSDIDEISNDGITPLLMACIKNRNIESIELLLEYGADKDAKWINGQTLLYCAAVNDDCTVLRYILEHHYYGGINEASYDGITPLHMACLYSKDIKSIELLLTHGANKAFKANGGQTLLHYAAANNDCTILKYILEHHYYGDINEISIDGVTPLHMACFKSSDTKSIELLLEYGAAKDTITNGGWTPLHFAAANENSTMLRYMLEHHCYDDINETNNAGRTALHHACANTKDVKSIELLLKYGADPEIVTSKGNNTLHEAALYNRREIVEYILEHLPMIDPAQKNSDGKTAAELTTDDDIKNLFKK